MSIRTSGDGASGFEFLVFSFEFARPPWRVREGGRVLEEDANGHQIRNKFEMDGHGYWEDKTVL